MKLHYFYPQNDLALADGGARYIAPAGARSIAEAGAALPLWYGSKGDYALCYGVPAAWYDAVMSDFDLGTDVAPLSYVQGMEAAPWGWSAASRHKFASMGFPPETLPTDEHIDKLRALSHRRTSAMLATALSAELPWLPINPAEEYTDAEALCKRLQAEGGVIKTPWSTSGRGVAIARTAAEAQKACQLATSSIAKQGSAMYEPAYERALDFAMLYDCGGGKCRPCGTSVFTADAHGHYTGNLMADEATRLAKVAALCPADTLAAVRDALCRILEREVAPIYSGPLGIDMLIATDGRLVPVVELNLRMTMGHVANILSGRLLSEGMTAVYSVSPLAKGVPYPEQSYTAAGGRLQGGTLQLVPPNRFFTFSVKCEI